METLFVKRFSYKWSRQSLAPDVATHCFFLKKQPWAYSEFSLMWGTFRKCPLKVIWPMNLNMVPPYTHHLEACNWFCDPGLMLHRTSRQIILVLMITCPPLTALPVFFFKKKFFAMPCGMWDPSSPTRDWNPCPCSAGVSLSHWTAWEVSHFCVPLWPSLFATYGKACSGL